MSKEITKILDVSYHRNGVSGEGFHLVQFNRRDGHRRVAMAATVFETPGQIAVFQPDDLSLRWRGDVFEPELRKAVEEWNI